MEAGCIGAFMLVSLCISGFVSHFVGKVQSLYAVILGDVVASGRRFFHRCSGAHRLLAHGHETELRSWDKCCFAVSLLMY